MRGDPGAFAPFRIAWARARSIGAVRGPDGLVLTAASDAAKRRLVLSTQPAPHSSDEPGHELE